MLWFNSNNVAGDENSPVEQRPHEVYSICIAKISLGDIVVIYWCGVSYLFVSVGLRLRCMIHYLLARGQLFIY